MSVFQATSANDFIGSAHMPDIPASALLEGAGPETLIYKSVGGRELRLLMLKPEVSGGSSLPAVIWIHGGAWTSGSPEQFVPHCRYMAALGAVAFSVEYRLLVQSGTKTSVRSTDHELAADAVQEDAKTSGSADASGIADCLADCLDALRYIRERSAQLGVDISRIVIAGDSAGGHLASCIGTLAADDGQRPFASINCNGIVDLADKWIHSVRPLPSASMQSPDAAIRSWLERREEARRLSPLFRAAPGQPPSLTLHGLLDRTVEPEQALRYVETHRACGNDARLVLLPESKHAFILFGYTAAVEETMGALGEIHHFLSDIGFWDIQD